MRAEVVSLHLHPVKATRAVDVDRAAVELHGLQDDRRWAVVSPAGERWNATTRPRLLLVTATPGPDGALRLDGPGVAPLDVAVPRGGPSVPVDVTRLALAVDAGEAAARWFSTVLREECRLVWQDDPRRRPISSGHGGHGEPLSLADTGPLLLTSVVSLRRLNDWIADEQDAPAVPMRQLRPNVVVDGDLEPFVEDRWARVTIGGVPMRATELCDRCVVTTIDPLDLSRSHEPIRTLARHRRWDGHTWFGLRLAPLQEGSVAVGDEVEVLQERSPSSEG